MTRIAVLTDIHSNVPALEAVIADLRRQQVDEVLLGGDLVGRGPEGSKVVRLVRQLGWPSVRGNHEDYLINFRKGEIPEHWKYADEWAAVRWMAAELAEDDLEFLASLPMSLEARSAPGLSLVHGSPRSHGEGMGPWSSDGELAEHLSRVEGDLLVCGHTHRPMCREVAGGMVVNVGAVGLPFNRDTRAQYGLFTRQDGGWQVELRQVDYDLGEILFIYERTGFLEQGGVTAQLLVLELKHAVPYVVPFLKWAETLGCPASSDRLDDFLEFYDPYGSMRCFIEKLQKLASRNA